MQLEKGLVKRYTSVKKGTQTCGIDIVGLLIMDVMQPKKKNKLNLMLNGFLVFISFSVCYY